MASAQARYQQLQTDRNSVLTQARNASALTIPGLIPALGASNPHDVSVQPWSSLGARGVNNVAAKLLLSLFPAQRPFFRLDIDPQTAQQMGTNLGPAQDALDQISYKAMSLVEQSGSRPMWMEVFRHLVIGGNCLVFHPADGSSMRVWRLDQYVVRRDAQGKPLEIVVEEEVCPQELADDVLTAVGLADQIYADKEHAPDKTEAKVKLYTVVLFEDGNVIQYQEINQIEVPGSRGQAKQDIAGWQALRWQAVVGSDYGRSMVSEYAGDFMSMEEGWKAIIKFAAEAARIIRIADPNAAVDIEELAIAETGDVLTGYAEKIQTLELGKNQDFNTLWNVMQSIERRLSQAFLLTANTIRDAERVTAEEIRAVAQELEDSFGGTYSVLSSEAQTPYAKRILYILSKTGKAPKLPKDVTPMVVTGLSALGDTHETVAIEEWLNRLQSMFGPQWLAQYVDGMEVALRTGTGRGIIDVKGMLKSPDQIDAEQQQALSAQTVSQSTPEVVKGAMGMMSDPSVRAQIQEQMNNG